MARRGMMAIGLGLAMASGTIVPASAATRVGTLTCNVSAGIGFLVTSAKSLACTFVPNRGRPERYVGVVRRFGLDIGATSAGRLVWGVIAPTRYPGPGSLAGDYVGASGEITAGVGVGANALVGGSNRSFTLQPFSVQGQTGLSLAAGVGAITLSSAYGRRR